MIHRIKRYIGSSMPDRPGPRPPAPGAPAEYSLEAERIRKSFGPVKVLDDVSFRVRAGEFVTLLGPSGCGKTTLLRIIAGLEQADHGSVLLGGRAVDHLPANRRAVNTVFQSYALFPHLTVFENVAFGLRARRFPDTEVTARVGASLEMLRLADFARRYPNQISGGQRQRVALARALVNEPEVLLLDEPMSALDAKLRSEVQLELRRLQRSLGQTFVLVTHDQHEALTVSDRIVVMNKGHIEQEGPTARVYEQPRNRFVAGFFGAANLISARNLGAGRVSTPVGELRLRSVPPWESGTVAIHPEWIDLSDTPPAENGVQGVVRESFYRGDHVELIVDPGPLRVQVNPRLLAAPGTELWLGLPVSRLEVLDD